MTDGLKLDDSTKNIPNGTVWILGAGFSRSLGGPLMEHLFTEDLRRRMQPWLTEIPDDLKVNEFINLQRLFRRAYGDHSLEPYDPRPWQDAEEFLETLDRAVVKGDEHQKDRDIALGLIQSRDVIQSQSHNKYNEITVQHLAKVARQYLVAALYSFAPEGDVARIERWSPYVRWTDGLSHEDVILSFNYDRVVERASKNRIKCAALLDPSNNVCDLFEIHNPCFIKLHGSIDWRLESDGTIMRDCDPIKLLRNGGEPAIASPGPTKFKRTNEIFHRFWEGAHEAIKRAARIVFLGYRMPPTDNEAKRRILDAIQQNTNDALCFHIVLGPDITHPHVKRLQGLLTWAIREAPHHHPDPEKRVHAEPLGVEDFLAVVK